MKVALALLAFVLVSATAFPVNLAMSPAEFPVEKYTESLEGGIDILTGFFTGFFQTAKEDVLAIPDCFFGFPCAYSAISEFIIFVKEMEHFDIKEVAMKFYSLVVMGVIGCLQSCMIPYTYYMHFQPFFHGFNIETVKQFLLNGLMYNVMTIIYNGQDAIKAFMEQNYFDCGMNIGVIFWAVLVR